MDAARRAGMTGIDVTASTQQQPEQDCQHQRLHIRLAGEIVLRTVQKPC